MWRVGGGSAVLRMTALPLFSRFLIITYLATLLSAKARGHEAESRFTHQWRQKE